MSDPVIIYTALRSAGKKKGAGGKSLAKRAKSCYHMPIERKGGKLPSKVFLPKELPVFFGEWKSIYEKKWLTSIERIKGLCSAKGIKVEEIDYSMFQKAALILYEGAYVAERWEDLKAFVTGNPGKTFHVTESILRSGAKEENTAAKLFGNLHELQKYKHIADELLEDAVMVMPTAGGSFTRDQVRSDPITTNSLMGLYTNHCNLLDMAAIAVPENTCDRQYPFGITFFALHDSENLLSALAKEFLDSSFEYLAVCGLHKKGFPLEYQIIELGGIFVRHTKTDANYKLYKLDTLPVKPGLVRCKKGSNIPVDLYEVPKSKLGLFMDKVYPPLVIGNICLEDGMVVKGFLCEEIAAEGTTEIPEFL